MLGGGEIVVKGLLVLNLVVHYPLGTDRFVSSVNVSNTLVQAEIITHIGFEGLISADSNYRALTPVGGV